MSIAEPGPGADSGPRDAGGRLGRRSRRPTSRASARRARATARRRRTTPPSSACSARCCCPRTPSPTSSRSSAASTSTGPAHEVIFDAIIDLYGRGEPADPITVAAELQRRGELARDRRRALPPHALGQRPDRGQRRLLRRDRPREGHPAPPRRRRHQDRADRLRRRGPGRRRRRPGAGRGLQGHRPAHVRGLRAAVRHHGRRPRRDRGDRQPRGRAVRRAHRLRRPRRPDQRSARRPDDHRRGATRHRASRPSPSTCAARRRSTTT